MLFCFLEYSLLSFCGFNKASQCQCIRLFTYVSNVGADNTRLTCDYFIPIPPFLYCLDPKLALMVFS